MKLLNPHVPPKWLTDEHIEENPPTNYHYERSLKYYKAMFNAMGDWTDVDKIREIYRQRDRMRKSGQPVAVDHKIPLISKLVCGLQNEHNLEIIDEKENMSKSNTWWVHHPFDIVPLFRLNEEKGPEQLGLFTKENVINSCMERNQEHMPATGLTDVPLVTQDGLFHDI